MNKIYTDIPSYIDYSSMSELINLIENSKVDSEITWNGGGGLTGAGQVFISYLRETKLKVHSDTAGLAASMSAFMIPLFPYAKGANEADIMIHSVAGGENSTHKHTNKLLYDAWANKIDLVKFKEITGKDLKDVLFPEDGQRVDVWLTGSQCGQDGIKLFDENYSLLDKAASLENKDYVNKIDFTNIDYEVPENIKEKYSKQANIVKSNTNEMEIKDVKKAELQVGNPSVYNAIVEDGKKAEKVARTERIAEIKKYAKYDVDYAFDLIEKDASLSTTDVEHFMEKKFANKEVEELENGSEGIVNPGKKVAEVVDNRTVEEKEKEAALNAEKEAMLLESGFELKTDK